jgi:hypothetical protein
MPHGIVGRVREHAEESAPESERGAPALPAVAPLLSGRSAILAMQRSAGNRATGALLTRILAREPVTLPEVTVEGTPWKGEPVKAVQRELRRLRLYSKGVDGIPGFFTEQGLTEAFGGNEWVGLSNDELLARLQAAKRPAAGSGRQLRYGELFKDDVLDVTLGLGYLEGMTDYLTGLHAAAATGLESLGLTANRRAGLAMLRKAGRALADDAVGSFWVKKDAFTYSPPAGPARSIDVVVRVMANPEKKRGGELLDAFVDAMTRGDVAWYSGHGRFGSGPDFDQDFVAVLKDADGKVLQTLDDEHVLERTLRAEGDPWTVFNRRLNDGTLEMQITNAGNLWLNKKNAHPSEFGARLMYWALEHGATVATGAGGRLEKAAAASPQNYRVLIFDGCRSQDYDRSLRATKGFGTRDADIIESVRTVGFTKDAKTQSSRVEIETFLAFLRDVMAQSSGETITRDMNAQMKALEQGYTSDPYTFSGLEDNPSR